MNVKGAAALLLWAIAWVDGETVGCLCFCSPCRYKQKQKGKACGRVTMGRQNQPTHNFILRV